MRKKLFYFLPVMALSVLMSQAAFAEEVGQTTLAEEEASTEVSTEAEEENPVERAYTFTLNDVTYTLPCAVTEFTDNGWNLGSGTLDSNTYANTLGYYEDSNESLAFEVLNATDEDGVDINELVVVNVDITRTTLEKAGFTFETADGVSFDMTVSDIRELYGEPSSEHETYIKYRFQERYETEGLRDYGVVYLGEDGFTVYINDEDPEVIDRIELEYFGAEAAE